MPPYKRLRTESEDTLVTRPRAVTVSFSKGDDSKDQGDRSVIRARLPKAQTMLAKFKANTDGPNGYVHINRFAYVRQTNIDQYGIQRFDSSGTDIELFTPRKFKDAEAVSFNNKALTSTGYQTTTVAINGPTLEDVYVQKSSATFQVVNITQRRVTLEMYICYGKNGEGSAIPANDYNLANDMYGGNSSNIVTETPYIDMMKNETWLKLWNVTKVKFVLEQGEHQSYYVKGPSMYVMDPKSHCAVGTTPTTTGSIFWDTPLQPGNGCKVFFRMLNDMCLVGNNDAGTDVTAAMGRKIGAHHPINPIPAADGDQQGAVLVKIKEYYHMKGAPGLQDVDQQNFLNDFHTIAGAAYTESNVDTDQSMSLPAVYL